MPLTDTFTGKLNLEIVGVRLEIYHVSSETEDKVLGSGDAVQGETFFKIDALHGTRFHDPMIWAEGMAVVTGALLRLDGMILANREEPLDQRGRQDCQPARRAIGRPSLTP